jgi:hypothetical protein
MGNKGQTWRTIKEFLKENLWGLSITLWFVSAIFLFLSVLAIFFDEKLKGALLSYADNVGDWNWWIFIVSIVFVGIFTYLMWTTYKKRKEFDELIQTDSKASFVKKLDDLEFLAFQLGPSYQDKVQNKKQSFKIK